MDIMSYVPDPDFIKFITFCDIRSMQLNTGVTKYLYGS